MASEPAEDFKRSVDSTYARSASTGSVNAATGEVLDGQNMAFRTRRPMRSTAMIAGSKQAASRIGLKAQHSGLKNSYKIATSATKITDQADNHEKNVTNEKTAQKRKQQQSSLKIELKEQLSGLKNTYKIAASATKITDQADSHEKNVTNEKTAQKNKQQQSSLENERYCPVNQLKNIALDENGTFMSDFDPERSKREMRKLNRKIHKENKKQNQMYDEAGRLLENSLDVCDCLENDCPGCHFPCPKCGSEKCGSECRCERRWTFEQIEVEGTNFKLTWTATKLG